MVLRNIRRSFDATARPFVFIVRIPCTALRRASFESNHRTENDFIGIASIGPILSKIARERLLTSSVSVSPSLSSF
jgi:hypothetical protein